MPLINSPTNKARSANIAEVYKSYKSKGTIGNSTPKSDDAARKQAVAIGYSEQRRAMK